MWSLWKLCMRRLTSSPSWPKQTHSPPVKWRKRKSRQGWSQSVNCWSGHVFDPVNETHSRDSQNSFISWWTNPHLYHDWSNYCHSLSQNTGFHSAPSPLSISLHCRSERRLSSTGSKYTSSPTVTLTKMRSLSSRTLSWRWEPALNGVLLSALSFMVGFAGCSQSCISDDNAWNLDPHVHHSGKDTGLIANISCCIFISIFYDRITDNLVNGVKRCSNDNADCIAEEPGSQFTTNCTVWWVNRSLLSWHHVLAVRTQSVCQCLSLPLS